MKRALTVITTMCLLFISSFVSAAEKGKRHEKYIETLLKDKPASYYKMEINPITPSAGITTGHVIAYGHYIRPPYKVEVRDTCVFVNNVQVHPILWTPGMIEERRKALNAKTVEEKKREAVLNQSHKLYDSLIAENVKSIEAMRKVVDYLRSHKDCGDSIISYDEHTVHFYLRKSDVKGLRTYYPKIETKTIKPVITPEQVAKQFEQSYIKSLKKGRLKIISSAGSISSSFGGDFKNIRAILLNKNISQQDKFIRINEMTSVEHALMMLYNYKASEWLNDR
ncbi:MAG: hypothetical protein Q7U71_04105 [bacterium]|nr:hypothetical protein [bacterium]